MAKNLILSPKTAADIDRRVDRVLQGLGNPEPPLRLELVRELLKLDVGFYTADNPGMAREVVSRIRVATIQVFQRPTLLLDAIKKMSLKALYLPDRKRILLDGSLPALKHRCMVTTTTHCRETAMSMWKRRPTSLPEGFCFFVTGSQMKPAHCRPRSEPLISFERLSGTPCRPLCTVSSRPSATRTPSWA